MSAPVMQMVSHLEKCASESLTGFRDPPEPLKWNEPCVLPYLYIFGLGGEGPSPHKSLKTSRTADLVLPRVI